MSEDGRKIELSDLPVAPSGPPGEYHKVIDKSELPVPPKRPYSPFVTTCANFRKIKIITTVEYLMVRIRDTVPIYCSECNEELKLSNTPIAVEVNMDTPTNLAHTFTYTACYSCLYRHHERM